MPAPSRALRQAHEWIRVFLLDHEQAPEGTDLLPGADRHPHDRPDTAGRDFLFGQLRSTTAVLDHLFRPAAEPPVAVGEESVRYREFAVADTEAGSGPLNPDAAVPARPTSPPVAPAGAGGAGSRMSGPNRSFSWPTCVTCPLTNAGGAGVVPPTRPAPAGSSSDVPRVSAPRRNGTPPCCASKPLERGLRRSVDGGAAASYARDTPPPLCVRSRGSQP